MKAIKVTLRENNKLLYINVVNIINVTNALKEQNGTYILLANGESITVKETLTAILDQLANPLEISLE